MHGCAIVGVKGGSPNRSVRAHWLVGAVAGWSSWLGGRRNFPPSWGHLSCPQEEGLDIGRAVVYKYLRMILAVPTLEENIVLIQSSLFTLMIIVVCKLDYLMYIKYVNTGDSSLTAERSFLQYRYYFSRQHNSNHKSTTEERGHLVLNSTPAL